MKDKIIHSKLIQWISGWKISKKLREHPFFSKFINYEFISYLVVGVLTTVVNYVIFWICTYLLDMSTVPSNTIAFIIAVTFAYVANKIFVFDSPSWKFRVIWKEFTAFIVSRLLSWGIETLFLWVTIDLLHWPKFLMKVIASVFVIIVNFFTSRFSFRTAGRLGKKDGKSSASSDDPERETEEGSST
ncbi:MAG: GtrA family protein [Lachnospiraceae bacterium]|nr:GtrA family protein [Lachnospiraceae bacterium]